MKIFEKIVYNQMVSFTLDSNILHSNQSGFQNGFPTSSAALILYNSSKKLYLKNRQRQVLVNETLKYNDILIRKPLLSVKAVLGPLFFLVYINDINSIITINSSYFYLYIDDIIIILLLK